MFTNFEKFHQNDSIHKIEGIFISSVFGVSNVIFVGESWIQTRSIKSPFIPSLPLPHHMLEVTGPNPGDRTMKLASMVWTTFPQNFYILIVDYLSIKKQYKLQISVHTM